MINKQSEIYVKLDHQGIQKQKQKQKPKNKK